MRAVTVTKIRNILALDVGDRRIGVALANAIARLPSPLMTIDRQATTSLWEDICEIIQDNDASDVVVGLPRGMEGQETTQTSSARDFALELSKYTSAHIHMQDEAGTSLLAEEELKSKNRPYQKADIDKLAAVYILRDWLSSQGLTS